MVAFGLPPDGLRLRLNAGHGVEDDDAAVEDAEAAFDFGGEVDVAGVSMMLMRVSRQWAVVAAAVMVMPRSRSWSIQSMVAVPSWTSPIL